MLAVDKAERGLPPAAKDLKTSVRISGALRQSILKQAFEGRLVPQVPNDEPAAVLLERIRATRDTDKKQRMRRPTKPKRKRKNQVP